MDRIRLVYSQTGRAVWMSHLDAMRTLQRATNRAGVPIRYSEGFNPHALISILMPLSVGTESLCQMADIRVREDVDLSSLPARLTAVMPEGIRALEAYTKNAAYLLWCDDVLGTLKAGKYADVVVFADDYLNFIGEYPESKYRRELDVMYKRSQNALGRYTGSQEELKAKEREFEVKALQDYHAEIK